MTCVVHSGTLRARCQALINLRNLLPEFHYKVSFNLGSKQKSFLLILNGIKRRPCSSWVSCFIKFRVISDANYGWCCCSHSHFRSQNGFTFSGNRNYSTGQDNLIPSLLCKFLPNKLLNVEKALLPYDRALIFAENDSKSSLFGGLYLSLSLNRFDQKGLGTSKICFYNYSWKKCISLFKDSGISLRPESRVVSGESLDSRRWPGFALVFIIDLSLASERSHSQQPRIYIRVFFLAIK